MTKPFPPATDALSSGQSSLPAFEANRFPLDPGLRLLEASAGTGKTFALAHLVLRLVTEPRSDGFLRLNQLLVVTFTNAAAAELRDRIARRLQEGLRCLTSEADQPSDGALAGWLAGLPEEPADRDRLRGQLLLALEEIDSADITTIHGFCSRTLQRQALEAGRAPDLKLETEAGILRQELCHDYWQGQVLALPPELLAGLQKRGLQVDRLAEVLSSLDSDPALGPDPLPEGLRSDRPMVEQLEAVWLEPWDRFVTLWRERGTALEQSLRDQARRWRQEYGATSTTPYAAAPRSDRAALISGWLADQPPGGSYRAVLEQDKLLAGYFHPGAFCKVARALEHPDHGDPSLPDPALMAAIAAVVDGPAERLLLHFCHWVRPELARRREQRGTIGFSQLLEALDPGDGEGPGSSSPQAMALLEAVGRRYAVALIDEFQDTDPIQWRILERCFVATGRHLLVMVGDPKQAIYRFRGGELATYRAARAASAAVVGLGVNHRSSAVLLDQLNRLMAPGLLRSRLPVPQVSSPETESARQPRLALPAAESPLQLLWFGADRAAGGPLPSLTAIEAELPEALARWVQALLGRGLALEHRGRRRLLGPEDLCLLVTRHQQAEALRQALERRGLATRLVSSGDVMASEGAMVLQRCLDALADPGDGNRLRLLAASPLLAWSAERLAATTPLQWSALAARLGDWAEQLSGLGLLGVLNQLLQRDGLARLTLRGRVLADLQQAATLVQEQIHREALGPRAAADWLRRRRLDPDLDPPDTHQLHSDAVDAAISVVTVHRSKGLEYPVVICPYLWQAPSQRSRGLGIRWSPPGSHSPRLDLHLSSLWGQGWAAAAQDLEAQEQERERLAYVAVTRAQVLLVLCYAQVAGHDANPLLPWLVGEDPRFGADGVLPRGAQGQQAEGSVAWRERLEQEARRRGLALTLTLLPSADAAADPGPAGADGTDPPGSAPDADGDGAELVCAAVPTWPLETSWGRSSYSGWTQRQGPAQAPAALEEGRDRDAQVAPLEWMEASEPLVVGGTLGSEDPELRQHLLADGPLAAFPRGAAAGDCLHRILERVDFQLAGDDPETQRIVQRELARSGVASSQAEAVGVALDRLRLTPFGGALGRFQLAGLTPTGRLPELSFDLPLAASDDRLQLVRARDLAAVFRHHPGGAFGEEYAGRLAGLSVASRGFLTGSIDLVFAAEDQLGQRRWWVVDWKSNWIGERDAQGQPRACAPRHYHPAALRQAMVEHHYPLQAHLYLVALHRYLGWRLNGYRPERDLGGYGYVFLRGVPGPLGDGLAADAGAVPGVFVERPPLDRILALDALLQEGTP
ncbi:MAG: UvrD-helicase domain-containing protein [Cyanobacteriota bacterium]